MWCVATKILLVTKVYRYRYRNFKKPAFIYLDFYFGKRPGLLVENQRSLLAATYIIYFIDARALFYLRYVLTVFLSVTYCWEHTGNRGNLTGSLPSMASIHNLRSSSDRACMVITPGLQNTHTHAPSLVVSFSPHLYKATTLAPYTFPCTPRIPRNTIKTIQSTKQCKSSMQEHEMHVCDKLWQEMSVPPPRQTNIQWDANKQNMYKVNACMGGRW